MTKGSTVRSFRRILRKSLGVIVTVSVITIGLPTSFLSPANAAFGGQIGGAPGYPVTGTTSTLSSGTATVTLKYLRKDRAYSGMRAWVWCSSGTGTWGSGVKVGDVAASGSCANGAWVDLGTEYDSWGSKGSFTVTSASSLVSFGIKIYNSTGGANWNWSDSQSTNDRYFNVNGANTTAWISDDGLNIYDGDPKTNYSTAQQYTSGAFRIHYNRPDASYTDWYARLGFEKGSNNSVNYTNVANKITWLNTQSYNFLTGATSGTLGTVTTGTDAFGPWVQLAPSATFYTGGYTYFDLFIGQATSLANADTSTWTASDPSGVSPNGEHFQAPTTTAGIQDIYIKSNDTNKASNDNPYVATQPTVTNTPSAVAAGGASTVTLSGTNFTPVASATPVIYIDGTRTARSGTNTDSLVTPAATVTPNADFTSTSLSFTMPATTPGSHTIYVATAAGITTGTAVTTAAAPMITATSSPAPVRGQTITVSGTNFDGANAVWTFAGATVSPSPLSATSATYTIPANAVMGSHDLVITTSGGSATATFTVTKGTPTVSGCSATGVLQDQALSNSTISGCSASSNGVTVAGTYAWASPSATPTNGGSYTINFTPTDAVGFNSTTSSATVAVVANAPVVSSVVNTTVGSGTEGKVGDTVTITGTDFAGSTGVKFGATSAVSYTVVNGTTVTAVIPAGVTTGSAIAVQVLNPAGNSNTTVTFTVWAAPAITSLSKTEGGVGDSVTITGTGLKPSSGTPTVSVGGTSATVTSSSNTSVTFTVPAVTLNSAQSVTVTNIGGTSGGSNFTARGVPTLSAISPTPYAKRGATVTLTGTNFNGATKVSFGSRDQNSITVVNNTTITALVPVGASSGVQAVTVTNPAGTSGSVNLTIGDAPTASASPTSAARGATVTLSGTNLTDSTWTFAGSAITPNALTATSAIFTIPVNAAFGSTSFVGTTSFGSVTVPFTVLGYSSATLTIHYNKQTFSFTNRYIHSWISSGTGTVSGALVGSNTPETSVTDLGVDSYGGLARITYTGSDIRQVGFLVWTLPGNTKDTGSTTSDRFRTLSTDADEIWIRDYTATVSTSDPFGAINPSPNRSATQTVTIHYDGDIATYPKVHVGANSGLNDPNPNPSPYWVGANTLDFTTPVTTTGTTGSSTSVVGTDRFGAYVTYTFPFNAAHSTWANMIVGNDGLMLKDGGKVGTNTRYAPLDPSGTTNIWLISGDTVSNSGNAAFTANPYVAPTLTSLSQDSAYRGDSVTVTGSNLLPATSASPFVTSAAVPVVTVGGISAVVLSNDVSSITFQVPTDASVGSNNVVVTTAGGVSGPKSLNVLADRPVLESFSPDVIHRGDSVTVAGTNLDHPVVTIDATSVVVDPTSTGTSVKFTVPMSITPGIHTLTLVSDYGTATKSDFTVAPDRPTITSFTPTHGYTNDSVTITGTSLSTTTSVQFAGQDVDLTKATITDQSIVVLVPETVTGSITVTTAGGTVTSDGTFTFKADQPVVTSVDPSSVHHGDSLTISGAHLLGASVTIGGQSVDPMLTTNATATLLTVVVPANVSPGEMVSVTVTTGGGTDATATVTVLPDVPTILALSKTQVKVGQTVTITGTALANPTSVTFDGDGTNPIPADLMAVGTSIANDGTSITVVVPAGAQTGTISVSSLGGAATSGDSITIFYPPAPTITSLDTVSGKVGDSVTVSGTNLTGATVTVAGTNAVIANGATDSLLTITVPDVAVGVTTVVVTVEGGTASRVFTVLTTKPVTPPSVTSVDPVSGVVGSSVTLTGANLLGAVVSVGSVDAVVADGASDSSLTFTVPTGVAVGATSVVITTTQGSVSTSFTVLASAPVISALDTVSGKAGDMVMVSGANLTGATVSVNGAAALVSGGATDSSLVFTVPDVPAGLTTVFVATDGGTTSTDFTVLASAPVISLLDPASAKVGDTVTVTGAYLTGATVMVAGVNANVADGASDSSLTFTVPSVAIGVTSVEVTTSGGTVSSDFTVLQTPQTLTINFHYQRTDKTFNDWKAWIWCKDGSGTFGTGLYQGTVAASGDCTKGAYLSLNSADLVAQVSGQFTITTALNVTQLGVIIYKHVGSASISYGDVRDAQSKTDRTFDLAGKATDVVVTDSSPIITTSAFALPPTVMSLDPVSAPVGSQVTVSGDNLTGATVTVGGVAASIADGATDSSFTFIVPELPIGATTVVVTTDGGNVSSDFTVAPPVPTVTSVDPMSGKVGDTVTISGTNLTNSTVTVGGVAAAIADGASDSSLTFTIPDVAVGLTSVVLTADGGTVSFDITVLPPAPVITSLNPMSAKVGDAVTVTGTNLTSALVTVAGTAAVIADGATDSSLTFTVPDVAIGLTSVVVTTDGGSASSDFTVASPIPVVTTFDTFEGVAGDVVTVTGMNLTGATVTVGGVDAVVSDGATDSALTFVIPVVTAGATTVVLTTGAGQASIDFTVLVTPPPAPSITLLSSDSGIVGDTVTITGANLTGATVTVGGVDAVIANGASASSLTFSVPAVATGTTTVVVKTDGGTVSQSFTVLVTPPPAPSIVSISPASGKVGSSATVSGTNLTGAKVTVAGVNAVIANGATASTLRFTVPTIAVGSTTVVVTTDGGTASHSFTVLVTPPPAPKITSFAQSKSTKRGVGTVTVVGTNLTKATVKVNGIKAKVKSSSATKLTFIIPATVKASAKAKFTITTSGGTVTSKPKLKITLK